MQNSEQLSPEKQWSNFSIYNYEDVDDSISLYYSLSESNDKTLEAEEIEIFDKNSFSSNGKDSPNILKAIPKNMNQLQLFSSTPTKEANISNKSYSNNMNRSVNMPEKINNNQENEAKIIEKCENTSPVNTDVNCDDIKNKENVSKQTMVFQGKVNVSKIPKILTPLRENNLNKNLKDNTSKKEDPFKINFKKPTSMLRFSTPKTVSKSSTEAKISSQVKVTCDENDIPQQKITSPVQCELKKKESVIENNTTNKVINLNNNPSLNENKIVPQIGISITENLTNVDGSMQKIQEKISLISVSTTDVSSNEKCCSNKLSNSVNNYQETVEKKKESVIENNTTNKVKIFLGPCSAKIPLNEINESQTVSCTKVDNLKIDAIKNPDTAAERNIHSNLNNNPSLNENKLNRLRKIHQIANGDNVTSLINSKKTRGKIPEDSKNNKNVPNKFMKTNEDISKGKQNKLTLPTVKITVPGSKEYEVSKVEPFKKIQNPDSSKFPKKEVHKPIIIDSKIKYPTTPNLNKRRTTYNFTNNTKVTYSPRVFSKRNSILKTTFNIPVMKRTNLMPQTNNLNRKSLLPVQMSNMEYQCNLCRKSFRLTSTLAAHKKLHENNQVTKCKYCDKEFAFVKTLHNHLVENCLKIPTSIKRKLIEKECSPSKCERNNCRNEKSSSQTMLTASISSVDSNSSCNQNNALTNVTTAMLPPKFYKKMPYSGVYCTPKKKLSCQKCKKLFNDVLKYTEHSLSHANDSNNSF